MRDFERFLKKLWTAQVLIGFLVGINMGEFTGDGFLMNGVLGGAVMIGFVGFMLQGGAALLWLRIDNPCGNPRVFSGAVVFGITGALWTALISGGQPFGSGFHPCQIPQHLPAIAAMLVITGLLGWLFLNRFAKID
jgi:hypothetical protein